MHTVEELRKLETSKLLEALKEGKKELFKTSFDIANAQAKNSNDIKKYRRYIARIKTILNSKQNAA